MLKKLERILKKKKKLILFTGLKIVNAFIGLIVNMFIVRKISVEEFGTYSIILSIIGFLTTFGFSWSSSSIIYFGAREKLKYGSLNKTLWSRNYILLVSFSFVILLFLIYGKNIEEYIGLQINSLLIIWLIIRVGLDTLNGYFIAIKEQLSSAILLIIGKILFLLFVMFSNYSLEKLILVSIICEATGIIYIFKVNKSDIGKPEFDRENFKEVLNFGLWQLFGFSGLYLINFGDNFIIKHFLTTQDVGIYNAAYKIFNALASISIIFSSYYAPTVVEIIEKKDKKVFKEIFYRERLFLIILFILIHVGIIVFSNKLILLIYGEKYILSSKILRVLMLASLIRFVTVFNVLIFNSLKKHKKAQILNILQAILNIVFDIIFISKFGIIGAAYGTLLGILISRIIGTIYCEKQIIKMVEEG